MMNQIGDYLFLCIGSRGIFVCDKETNLHCGYNPDSRARVVYGVDKLPGEGTLGMAESGGVFLLTPKGMMKYLIHQVEKCRGRGSHHFIT